MVEIFMMTGSELLIASAKIQERQGSISPSSFYGQLPNYLSYVLALSPSGWVLFFAPDVAERNDDAGWI